jgi:hypothetical protein
MSSSQRLNSTLAVQKYEMEIIEAALSYCAALPEQKSPHDSNSPLAANYQGIESLRKALSTAEVAKVDIADEHLHDPDVHLNWWSIWTFIVPLSEDQMMALDALLLCYQAHCRARAARKAEGLRWVRHDEWIEFIRQGMRFQPQSTPERPC